MRDYVITVMALDRVGIVRDVSSALCGIGGNITHLSQTVLRGYFTLIISAELPDGRTALEVKQAVERSGRIGELEVIVRAYLENDFSPNEECEHFTLSMQGRDQKGIIARTTSYLAECGVNVDDFNSFVHDEKLLMLAQVSVPAGVDVDSLQTGLQQVGKDFGLLVNFQHEDIFRATSDVTPVVALKRGKP